LTPFWKGITQGLFGQTLISFHPVVPKKIFKDFQLFNQSEAMEAILDIQQGHWT
jgi:hypothetical protein